MAEKFKAGDVVQLKSSSPKMTVGGYNMAGMVICNWFVGTDSNHDTLDEDQLELAKD